MEIGLVLGGGGARGFAHIGVLRALDEHSIRPVAIAGCSMGGIVGALYAAGHTPVEIEHMFEDISGFDLMSWGKGGSLIGGEGIVKQLANVHQAQRHQGADRLDLGIELELGVLLAANHLDLTQSTGLLAFLDRS